VPEMFNKVEITIDRIVKLMISSMVKRMIDGVEHGVAILSEGIFHFLSNEEITNSGISFTYDDHGHPELGNVSKAHIFNILVQRKLKELDIQIKSRPVELGYEMRCCPPVAYDLTLCTLLGMGARKLFHDGVSGAIVSTSSKANIEPVYLNDIEDPATGKIPPRPVDITSELAKMVFADMHVITPMDYEKARAYLPNPEEYDFCNILNWEFDPSTARKQPS
ncbi:MAG: 6-phosphofructokinase, partial [Bacteroidota bacterium]